MTWLTDHSGLSIAHLEAVDKQHFAAELDEYAATGSGQVYFTPWLWTAFQNKNYLKTVIFSCKPFFGKLQTGKLI